MLLKTKERKWILLVDDEPEIRSTIHELINVTFGQDTQVIEAQNGLEATNKINCQMFDCIITDLVMPKKEGSAFVASIRQNAFNETTPVIVLTGNQNMAEDMKKFDFVYLMQKPCDFRAMTELIKNQLKMGGTENRISADALNSLIKASSSFIKTFTKMDNIEQNSLIAKKAGEKIAQPFASTIQVKIGKVTNYFSIMMNAEDIENFKQLDVSLSNKKPDELLQSLSSVILKYALNETKLLDSNKFNTQSIITNPSILDQQSGLVLFLGNEKLKIGIFASTKKTKY